MRESILITAMTALAGCNAPDEIKLTRAGAAFQCLQLVALSLGISKTKNDDVAFGDNRAITSHSFRRVSTGQFVTTFEAVRFAKSPRQVDITFTGDFSRGQISSVQIDGTVNRLAKPKEWVFE